MQKAKSSLYLFSFHCEHYSDERILILFSAHKHKMICISETQGIVPSLATALEVSLSPRDDQGKLLPHQELRRDEEITGLLFFGNLCVGSIYTSTTLALYLVILKRFYVVGCVASFWEMKGGTLRPETWGQSEGQYTEKPKS